MAETKPTIKVGQASATANRNLEKVKETGSETRAASQQLASSALDPSAATPYKVTYVWDRVHSDDFTLSDDYVFSYGDVSEHGMMHTVQICLYDGRRTVYTTPSEADQKQILSELCRLMDSAQLLETDRLPGIYFTDSEICFICPNEKTLVDSFNLLNDLDTLASFSVELDRRGFPFRPQFWQWRGILSSPDEKRLAKDVRKYLCNHVRRLGKTRAVWAKFYEVSGLEGRRAFTGNLIFLTDAATIIESDDVPPFRGFKPEATTNLSCARFFG